VVFRSIIRYVHQDDQAWFADIIKEKKKIKKKKDDLDVAYKNMPLMLDDESFKKPFKNQTLNRILYQMRLINVEKTKTLSFPLQDIINPNRSEQ
jgi:hypothetical protein